MSDNKPEAEANETEKRRIEIKDIAQPEQELTAEEEKEVKGGGFHMTPAPRTSEEP